MSTTEQAAAYALPDDRVGEVLQQMGEGIKVTMQAYRRTGSN